MSPSTAGRTLGAVWSRAARHGAQIRLLALWLIVLAVPTLFLLIPLMTVMAPELNYSPSAVPLASTMSLNALNDLFHIKSIGGPVLTAIFTTATVAMFLTSAWLNALALGATRAFGRPKFRVLIGHANAAYWSMVRMGLWSLVPIGVVLVVANMASHAIAKYDESAILASSIDHLHWIARVVVFVLYVTAQCSIETGRALLVAHPRRRSVVRAWFAGLSFLKRHPVRIFGTWLIVTLPVLLLVGALMVLRLNLDQGHVLGSLGAVLLAELAVLALAWMRCTRIFALVDLVALSTARR